MIVASRCGRTGLSGVPTARSVPLRFQVPYTVTSREALKTDVSTSTRDSSNGLDLGSYRWLSPNREATACRNERIRFSGRFVVGQVAGEDIVPAIA